MADSVGVQPGTPEPGYVYPLGHVHVAATPLHTMHVATGRVPIELVLWHLISDWGVIPKAEDWRRLLEGSIKEFENRASRPVT
jgi:hypothetical protein